MPSKARFWTCQRVKGGVKCGTKNERVKQKCVACGGPRPKPRPPAHMKALDLPLSVYVTINGGRFCGVCGAVKALQRDHEHVGDGLPRGILCWRHNKLLSDSDWTPETLRAAADYLERAERWRGVNLEAFV